MLPTNKTWLSNVWKQSYQRRIRATQTQGRIIGPRYKRLRGQSPINQKDNREAAQQVGSRGPNQDQNGVSHTAFQRGRNGGTAEAARHNAVTPAAVMEWGCSQPKKKTCLVQTSSPLTTIRKHDAVVCQREGGFLCSVLRRTAAVCSLVTVTFVKI